MPLLKLLIINLIENVYSQIIFHVNVFKFFSNCKSNNILQLNMCFISKLKTNAKTKVTRETQTKLGKTYLNMHDFIIQNPIQNCMSQ